ncbi:hypothetical protein CKR_0030 [Clostridium kluyveri NBRC 12016]|nr:hypothetical protein CKR_0030 [Clostridium kluyveri NBRC 12016]
MNYYIGLLGWHLLSMNISFFNQNIYWIFFSIIVICVIIGITANKFLPYFLRSSFYVLGYYWLAALSYFIIFIIIFNIIVFLNKIIHFSKNLISANFVFSNLFIICVVIVTITLLIYGTFNAKKLKIKTYNVNIPKNETILKELNIVMISDIHISNIDDKRQNKIINVINNLNPDIVFIVGDILDDIIPFVEYKMMDDFHKINSKYGVYACLGNHDYLNGDLSYMIDKLNESKINVLRDSVVEIAHSFYIIGREDKSYEMISKQKRIKLSNIVERINSKLPIIMLDHQPIDIPEAEDAGIDLQLSGHTHKGQFFPFNFITNKLFKVHYGYLRTGRLQVVVSCGAGTWGPPIRIGSTSEVVNIIVKFQK